MKNKHLLWIGIVITLLSVLSGLFYLFVIRPQIKIQEAVRKMEISDINIARVSDGVYRGEFEYSKTGAVVELTVKDGMILSIDILKGGATKHGIRAEVIVDHVVRANSTQVDVITGSTTTSKALLKAIERALQKGIRN